MHIQGQSRDQGTLFPEWLDDLIAADNAVRVCRANVKFCRSQALYGGEQIAIDGSKFSADNTAGKVTRRKDLQQQATRLDRKIGVWLDDPQDNDDDDEPPSGGDTLAALVALRAERESLTERIQAMDDTGISAQPDTDPEARVMRHRRIGYSVQSMVDSKQCMIADVDVVKEASDIKQLYHMARRTQVQLNSPTLELLADAGYSNGKLLKRCQAHGITPYVPVQTRDEQSGWRPILR